MFYLVAGESPGETYCGCYFVEVNLGGASTRLETHKITHFSPCDACAQFGDLSSTVSLSKIFFFFAEMIITSISLGPSLTFYDAQAL